jgi:rhodanese-related sulfurtransferase
MKKNSSFCIGGLRSSLSAKTLRKMGFENVSRIHGGFSSMKNSEFEID